MRVDTSPPPPDMDADKPAPPPYQPSTDDPGFRTAQSLLGKGMKVSCFVVLTCRQPRSPEGAAFKNRLASTSISRARRHLTAHDRVPCRVGISGEKKKKSLSCLGLIADYSSLRPVCTAVDRCLPHRRAYCPRRLSSLFIERISRGHTGTGETPGTFPCYGGGLFSRTFCLPRVRSLFGCLHIEN